MPSNRSKILLTGGHGFLGKIIYKTLSEKGYELKRLGRSNDNEIKCDLAQTIPAIDQPIDLVIHNAGKAHVVPKTESESKAFFDVNVTGTKNLLKAFEKNFFRPSAIVFISTIAVYGVTKGEDVTEDHALLASDPYGKSKIEAENVIIQWCHENSVSCVVLRLPLLAGENPPGNLGAMISAIKKGFYVSIDGGKARKSIVMAKDVAAVIPLAVRHPGIYNLTDGYNAAFNELESIIAQQLHKSKPLNIPLAIAKFLGVCGDIIDKILPGKSPITSSKIEKIKSTLTFNDEKARHTFGWNPSRVIDTFKIE